MTADNVVLVTGATGNVGRQVVSQLVAAGVPVRALTRDPDSAGLPAGVDVVRGVQSDPAALAAHLAGVDRVFLMWPSERTETAADVVAALAGQVRRVVLLSSGAVRDGVPPAEQTHPIGRRHAELEAPIERSGLEWTFLRPLAFATNTLWWAPEIRAGAVRGTHGDARMTLIHEHDIAAVAVRALVEDTHVGQKYLLTGPDLVSLRDQVRIIGEALGRRVDWVDLSPADAREQMFPGLPRPLVSLLVDGYAGMVDNPWPGTDTVARVTGTPARTFREWVADHVDDFR
ncbi:NAD(P)H-binding protein [Goodfellowiella coeruleoviolacea]|uniref:Uncharacterized conserved protein YbjT, contains NAD(P)-binding and DUF2867 domains n=1 Tax=Goodfellowiella coeruleoviolacea TaxID=334858 RepID=A0AAE3GEB3_9PSEU|nr:NAD(P)H-binding protein [Goodfellowiella coeruleoviolacea]MCP2165717.1 Uncharacterized conserved protein YbjT, contains NAD(P)-binding and DUF2867 domains [Goodfellowiella coeruleoviolacea]